MKQHEDSQLGGKPGAGWAGLHGNWETGTWPYTGLESRRRRQSGNILTYITINITYIKYYNINRHIIVLGKCATQNIAELLASYLGK